LALLEARLKPEQRQFVHSLVAGEEWDYAKAARAAGYEGSDPKAFALRVMKDPLVTRCLALIQADRRERYKDVRDGAIQFLWQLSVFDVKDLAKRGELLPPDQLPDGIRCAIKEVKKNQRGEWEYKLVDRTTVLQMLLKHFELTDNVERGKAETKEGVTVVFTNPDSRG